MEYLNELETSANLGETIPLGLKEILASAPRQVKLPTGLLNWVRQCYIEQARSHFYSGTLEVFIRTIGIDNFYSPVQIQAVIDRVKLELQNNTQMINNNYQKISKN